MRRNLLIALAVVLATVGVAFAQGSQTATLSGTVVSTDGRSLPGVNVSVKSDALLGTRSAVTDANGGYIFKALPPGAYTVSYSLSGFATLAKRVKLDLGATIPLDATLSLATREERVEVTAEAPTPLTTTQGGANYKQDMIDTLATARTVFGVAQMAPGLTTNTPNANQVKIAGNFAYDNVFLVDGVDVNDNLFGTANNLFVEDALQETQILTSGISAEYGRFGGGVINTITKHGGNKFSGSLRLNLSKPSWRANTPYEDSKSIERSPKMSKFWEGTLGGPIVKDRLWFFGAGRKEASQTQITLNETGLPFTQDRKQWRWQGKLTGAITPDHTVTASYLKLTDTIYRETFTWSIDPVATAYTGKQPNTLFVLNYNGMLRSNLFVEAQYSKKYFEFVDSGGTSTAIIDSPYIAQSVLAHYNAPYFDATDPEQRNNRQFTGALSYFLSTKSLGKHDMKVGFENFRSTRTGGNSQSSTNYVFYTDYLTDAEGLPARDASGYIIPVFTPDVSQIQLWMPVRGAKIDITTSSAYLNDRWTLNSHWSFNLGLRAEWAKGKATGGVQPVNASRIVPRLAASFDVRGDGKFKLDATYSQYAGKYSESQFANNTNVGNPDFIYYIYTGPEGQGRDFAPGIDPKNYTVVATGGFPTANIFYDKNIKSPVTNEWTGAFGMQLGSKGWVKTIYTWRNVRDFVQVFVTRDTGTTHVVKDGIDFGTFSNQLWKNSNEGERKYQGLQFQMGYRPTERWALEGHYTIQLKNDGNQEGEGSNTPGAPSYFPGYYPEIFNAARTYPMGRLVDYQRHRLRLWTTYDLSLGRIGDLNAGLLFRLDSGTAYSIRANNRPLTSIQNAILAEFYPDAPADQPVYFSQGRGSEFYNGSKLFDLALTYSVKTVKTVRPWVKAELRNVFSSTPLIGYNTTVTPDSKSPKDELGIPTGFVKGSNFGKGTATGHYPFPREFLVSMGVRF